jgi:iron complex transport system substrate-binding protein
MLVSIAPAAAAPGDQDTKSFTLEIFGNANMDDTIDDEDIEYVEDVIKGTKESTNLTDANNDGNIDEKDIDQIEMIIDGSNAELTLIDFDGVTKTVHLPAERIVTTYIYHAWGIEQLGEGDRIVAVDESILSRLSHILALTLKYYNFQTVIVV